MPGALVARLRSAWQGIPSPLPQLTGGDVGGVALTGLLTQAVLGDNMSIEQAAIVVGYSVLMLAVCLLACIVPTRRALDVQPMDP